MTDNKDNENENGYYSANNPFYYGFPGNNNQVATNLYIATSNNIASNSNFITNTCPKPQVSGVIVFSFSLILSSLHNRPISLFTLMARKVQLSWEPRSFPCSPLTK
jgi:hypothetical protein